LNPKLGEPAQHFFFPGMSSWIFAPHHVPLVTVEIVKAPCINETPFHGLQGVRSASGDCLPYQFVDFFAVATGKREQAPGVGACIAELPFGEHREEFLSQEHDACIGVDDHARGPVVREFGIKAEAKLLEKGNGPIHVQDWQIDEELARSVG
jgi:hypothetical protein